MTEYIILYNAPKSLQHNCENMSEEDMSKMMQAWMKWAENCGEHLLDLGDQLQMQNVLTLQVLHQVVLKLEDIPSCKQIV